MENEKFFAHLLVGTGEIPRVQLLGVYKQNIDATTNTRIVTFKNLPVTVYIFVHEYSDPESPRLEVYTNYSQLRTAVRNLMWYDLNHHYSTECTLNESCCFKNRLVVDPQTIDQIIDGVKIITPRCIYRDESASYVITIQPDRKFGIKNAYKKY